MTKRDWSETFRDIRTDLNNTSVRGLKYLLCDVITDWVPDNPEGEEWLEKNINRRVDESPRLRKEFYDV